MQRFDPTASLRGRNRYPAFDTAIGNPQDGQLTPNNALLPPPYKGPAPMQEQSYATGVKPGSETLNLPMPQQAPDAMAEFQKLGLPPRRQQVERGRQSSYAPFVQALSGLGDVFAAKAGQRGNYLDRTIGLQQGQIEQEYGDKLRNAGTQYEGDQAAYNQRVQGMNLAHQIGRETVADKAREAAMGFQKERATAADKYSAAGLDLRKQEADRAEADRAFWRSQVGGGQGTDAEIGKVYDLQLGLGTSSEQAQKDILANTSIPLKERLRQVDLLQVAAQRKASGDEKLREGAYMFGQPNFTLREWGDLTKQFRETQDPEVRRQLLNQMEKINPAVPIIGSRYSQLPDDIAAWAKVNW